MNVDETKALLLLAAGLDRWLGRADVEERVAMLDGWSSMLATVPAGFAQRAVRDHYAMPDARSITPGDVLALWRARESRERQVADDQARAVSIQEALDAGGAGTVVFGSGAQYLADMVAAVGRGEDPASVVRPAGVRVLTLSPEAQARERGCRFPDICACTHLECRDGWLDVEGTRVNGLGKSYPAVERCPRCEEGLEMAQERGVARRPRRTAGSR